MNRKISRLLQPGMRFYFVVISLFAAGAALVDYRVSIALFAVILILFVYFRITMRRQRKALLGYVEEVTHSVESVKKDNMLNFPLPMVIFRLDNEEILWSNQRFTDMTENRETIFEQRVSDAVPGFDVRWLVEGKTECPELVAVGDRNYQVFGNIVRTEEGNQPYRFLGNAYWMDVTAFAETEKTYWNTRPVCALIVLDNYEELLNNLTEKEKGAILAAMDDKITHWSGASTGFLCKFDRNRYVHIFEDQHLDAYIQGRFSLLDSVREIVSSVGITATASIGIGKDGGSFAENFEYAKLGVEMALSRGGDQAVVKNRYSFEFYGGKTTPQERRTKVKSRVTASSLEKLMAGTGKVFIMGHVFADFDSLGAACAICCIARRLGKAAKIVMDLERNAAGAMIERLRTLPEYETAFISGADALVEVDSTSLLVVVDTNRPDQVESKALLEATHNLVVIDHHRRAADYIQNATINFHEPYASSTAELATELLQYIVDQADILRVEAEALMAGMVMDTKNFTLRTGSRTFEAAAFLRRVGANTTEVKRLMQSDFAGTVARYDVVRQAALYRDGVVIAAPDEEINRVTGAQAADELLNISGIQAAFVLYPAGDDVMISARSIGDVNVQFIVEQLGGGGNRSTAGAQVRERSRTQVIQELKTAIDAFFQDGGKEPTQAQL